MKKQICYIAFIVFTISCTTEIELDYPKTESEIVVDGWIEEGQSPVVLLTYSVPYFQSIDSNNISDFIITNASVWVSDGERTYGLTGKVDERLFPPYKYFAPELKGEAGKNYTLTIKLYEDTITATTYLPKAPKIDSLWFTLETGRDSLGKIILKIQDNPNELNYYQTFAKISGINNKYIPTLYATFPDNLINEPPAEVPLYRGLDLETTETGEIFFKIGQTVQVKVCAIDEASYKFWQIYQTESVNSLNPFATSSQSIVGNINGGLGIWSGIGASYKVISIKKPE